MKALREHCLTFISVLAILFTSGCQSNANEGFTIERSYSYTIRASISGNPFSSEGPTQFELKPKPWRRKKFRHLPEKANAIMYAYKLTSKWKYNPKLGKDEIVTADTIEAAVEAQQADSLFNLAKAVFESVSVSNVDTVYSMPKLYSLQFDDASGTMRIESEYGDIQINIGPLHYSKNKQSAPFLALYEGFEALFPEQE